MSDIFKFPRGFLWGAATSSYQVEGGNHNDWSEWEKSPRRIAELKKGGKNPGEYVSGNTCDHYNRFREDFDIAKGLGHNVHRCSIEWSRIEPEEGKFNEKEIEHYRQVIHALRERGMKPFVTLWHWTVPVWFQARGGWLWPKSPEAFTRFVERVAKEFGGDVCFWNTLNEPDVFTAYGYIAGIRPPQIKSIWKAAIVFHRLAEAHRQAYRKIHQGYSEDNRECYVGVAKHDKWFTPKDSSTKNVFLTKIAKFLWNDTFIWHIRGYQDYIGLNYYNRNAIDFGWSKPRKGLYNLEESPEGFYQVIMNLSRYQKPIYVIENGLDDRGDNRRVHFIRNHISAMAKAMRDGADVRGYSHWSLLDNFEWEAAFGPRFGLVEIDYKTLERNIRPSAWEYKKIIEANAIEL